MAEIKVQIFNRRRGQDDPTPWQADIWDVPGGSDHHGIGATPQEALLNAAMHWTKYEASKVDAPTS